MHPYLPRKSADDFLEELKGLRFPSEELLRVAAAAYFKAQEAERAMALAASFHRDASEVFPDRPICMPLNSEGVVAAGDCADIVLSPYVPFQPDRLAVDPACAQHFRIAFHRAANIHTVGAGSSPPESDRGYKATLFPPVPDFPETEASRAIHKALRHSYPIVTPASRMILQVINESTHPQDFRACLWGFDCLGQL